VPVHHAYTENFEGKLRNEGLKEHWFSGITHAEYPHPHISATL